MFPKKPYIDNIDQEQNGAKLPICERQVRESAALENPEDERDPQPQALPRGD